MMQARFILAVKDHGIIKTCVFNVVRTPYAVPQCTGHGGFEHWVENMFTVDDSNLQCFYGYLM